MTLFLAALCAIVVLISPSGALNKAALSIGIEANVSVCSSGWEGVCSSMSQKGNGWEGRGPWRATLGE